MDVDPNLSHHHTFAYEGIGFPFWILLDLMSFTERFRQDAYDKLDVIGIDEAQFSGDLYEFCCKEADDDGKIVIVAVIDAQTSLESLKQVAM
ncbi:hypothetical protein Bca52824_027619 [Brassica carinata]|uniref:Thymidine kinase n=1 Tax=Brassica carinata TaxID=52824 RepID=A0A8X7VAS7_BRACI|nr:hypothetical protein Bca52824_027619 [Brassica carinata]